ANRKSGDSPHGSPPFTQTMLRPNADADFVTEAWTMELVGVPFAIKWYLFVDAEI
ncbi:hypothetical protein DYB34_010499, partial [Aphanomyces astaci]